MTQCPYIMYSWRFITLGIRGKCYNFIEYLYKYLSSKDCVRVDGQLSESFNIKKGVPSRLSLSHQLCLTCSLMIFLIIVINMASLLVINVVVEVFLQMTRCYMLQQDLNFKKLFKILPVGGLEIMKMQFCINKMCLFL